MNWTPFLLAYLTLNLLIVVAYLALRLFQGRVDLSRARILRLHYTVIASVLLLTALHPFMRSLSPKQFLFEPPLKVWSASSFKAFPKEFGSLHSTTGFFKTEKRVVPVSSVAIPAIAVLALILLAALIRTGIDVFRISRLKQDTYLVRRLGQVRILVHPNLNVPLSFWLPRYAAVVIPEQLLLSRLDFKMAICHELQHHRQHDTRWTYLFSLLRFFCFLNPAAHLWFRWIAEIQEFACDETLVDRNKVESRQYVRCLIEVAQSSLHRKGVPASATGLTFLVERSLLKRRIEAMFQKHIPRRASVIIPAGILVALMTVTAVATQGILQDRRISRVEAVRLAEVARQTSAFPVVMNDLVLRQLNRFVGTEEGREYVRDSLARMHNYRPMIDEKMKEYGVPTELLAIPLIESRYQNLAPNNKVGWGAGIWMFIKSTARTYGLRVDSEVDERLNVPKLTDAAMRLLKSDYYRFQDWQLSVLAYNMGENAVQSAINKTGSRDAWVLIRQGFENDTDYLAELMAAIIIMKNPELFA